MKRVLVTGGGGFVGGEIIRQLTEQGVICEAIGRSRYPHLENSGIHCYQGDIADRDFVERTVTDFDVVFHVAALAGIWGQWDNYYQTNVQGTDNIVNGCIKGQVGVLIYTSTPSAVFANRDILKGDESIPYPADFLCHYAKSKAIAEKFVLGCNSDSLKTCAIRPHLIWGPGDPHLIPRLLDRGKKQQLKIVGDGANQVDISYIDNVAHAHILAAQELLSEGNCAGKPYFIGQERPVKLWSWINQLFESTGIPTITNKVSFPMAYGVGALLEMTYNALRLRHEPRMTRFLAMQLALSWEK